MENQSGADHLVENISQEAVSIPRGLESQDITGLLQAWRSGDRQALEQLMRAVYRELKKIAGGLLKDWPMERTLQPTALVHEAYLRLIGQSRVQWRNRSHFFAIAAKLMRRIVVDHARRRRALKRGGGLQLSLSQMADDQPSPQPGCDPLLLDDALRRLAKIDAAKSSVVELRFFGGLKVREVAEVLGCSKSTVERHWELARAWLYRELR